MGRADPDRLPDRDRPWVFRTYSGHSSARASNELYRANLGKGQTGLSVAFDLPTQTGYDADHPLARGEVGKVGVPISSIEDMEVLFAGIPLDQMNTSMTINATAAWLLALYAAVAENHGVDPHTLEGTTQNDLIKEFLSRGTYVFPPEPSHAADQRHGRLHRGRDPELEPGQRLQLPPAGGGRDARAGDRVLLRQRDRRARRGARAARPAGRRVAARVRADLLLPERRHPLRRGDLQGARDGGALGRARAERYGVADERLRRFRYGVQVNSLGLTEAQPENNAIRIVLEALGVTLSKKARCRALQLPAWNEALGLPRPWDQQWSLRIQQILAYETDLLEHEDLFDGSHVIEAQRGRAEEGGEGGAPARARHGRRRRRGRERLHEAAPGRVAHAAPPRDRERRAGVVGVNAFTESEPSPLVAGEGRS